MAFKGMRSRIFPSERRVLERLGAAVVSEWAVLPKDVQRNLFQRATGAAEDAATLKTGIARFLHKNLSERR